MLKAFSKIREELLYSTVVFKGQKRIVAQIDEDNRKVAIIWSVVELAFWILLLVLSVNDPAFGRCRPLYFVLIALNVITLLVAAFVIPKSPTRIRPLVFAMQAILLGAGIGLAFLQWDERSATLVAAVLIVPVMFSTDTLATLACVTLGLAVFLIAGPQLILPDVFSWAQKSLLIFAVAGVLLGHVINKARFERYAFEEYALDLAELRQKFAYYDQMTGLQNRRAYSEKVEELERNSERAKLPACCVVSVDVNGLKMTNDTYGHSAGDELIIGTAKCLGACFENAGEIYRLGGDEFCVITAQPEEDVAERMLHLEQMAAGWKGRYINGISLSYGFAASQGYQDVDAVLREADRKMYEYKRNYYATSERDRRHRPDTQPPATDGAATALAPTM